MGKFFKRSLIAGVVSLVPITMGAYAGTISKSELEEIKNLQSLQSFVSAYAKSNHATGPFWNSNQSATSGAPRMGYASEVDLNATGKNNWVTWSKSNHVKLSDTHLYYGFVATTHGELVFATPTAPDRQYGSYDSHLGANQGSTGSGDWTKNVEIYVLQHGHMIQMHLAQLK